MKHLEYTTVDGDRWDLIAYKYYGDATKIAGLIAANQHLPIAEQFSAGHTVIVPLLPATTSKQSEMPPWLR